MKTGFKYNVDLFPKIKIENNKIDGSILEHENTLYKVNL